ncbi:hypothetical protein B0H19DRAFT_1075607 [Mycena capillaripes]|nr:hypothetical protein B0H19DRAFT_1075607 [Mycena capillaripes]
MPIWCSRFRPGLVPLTLLVIRMMHERILLLCPGNNSRKILLIMLGDVSYRQWEGIDDLNLAIVVHRDAVREDPDDASSLVPLGCAFCDRFEQLGDAGDIDESVLALERSAAKGLDSDRAFVLHSLGESLLLRFYQLGAHDDLHRSLSVLADADRLTPDAHPDKCEMFTELGMAFMFRFQTFGDLDDLKNSIPAREAALRLTLDGHFDKSLHLEHLGNSLLLQFGRLGDLDSLNRSVPMLEEAVRLTPQGHPYRSLKLVNLGNALAVRFEQRGDLADLHRSVVVGNEGICAVPDGHINKPSALMNLGISLLTRFERLGNMDDLDRAILMYENALRENVLQSTPAGHPTQPSRFSYLADALMSRFNRVGDLGDLNVAVLQRDKALHLKITPIGQLRDLDDPDQSIKLYADAIQLTPDEDVTKPARLNNLGVALRDRFTRLGDINDLEKSALDDLEDLQRSSLLGEDAIRQTLDGHPDKPAWLGFRPRSQSQKPLQVLAVAQPTALGQTYIPGTKAEITSIQKHAKGKVPVLRLDANVATVDNVQAGMMDSHWVHFACHGVLNASDPTENFAFLSAGQTATGDGVLQGEAVHLEGGMLSAGYRGVIATMWTIMNSDAPRTAEVLHHAVRKLREESGGTKPFSHWVPFIHVGV